MSKKTIQTLSIAVGAALLGSVVVANAGDLFRVQDLGFGYRFTGEEAAEGKCGEGKCGETMKKAEGEGKCGEGMKKAEGEGKCGEGMKKAEGEGKCGEGMKKAEG